MALHESYLPVFIFGFSRLWQNTLIGVTIADSIIFYLS